MNFKDLYSGFNTQRNEFFFQFFRAKISLPYIQWLYTEVKLRRHVEGFFFLKVNIGIVHTEEKNETIKVNSHQE